MGESFLIQRGGGVWMKATDALLRVKAPASSMVVITKGTSSMTDSGHESSGDSSLYVYHFVIPQELFDSENAWTITASYGTQSATDSVIIDSADDYLVEISYRSYIYNRGTQYYTFSSQKESSGGVSFGSEYIRQSGSQNSGFTGVYTTQKISVDDYNSLFFEIDYKSNPNSTYKLKAGISTASNWYPTFTAQGTLPIHSGVIQTLTIDISNITGQYYICINGTINADTYSIYME